MAKSNAENKLKRATNNVAGLTSLHAGVLHRLSAVEEANTALEGKLAAILAGSLVLLTIVLDKLRDWDLLSMFGVYFLVVAVCFCSVGAWPSEHRSSTVDVRESKYRDYIVTTNRELLLRLIVTAEAAGDKLQARNKAKSQFYKIAAVSFIVGSGMCVVSFFVNTVKI
ncbi:MAG TPA: hypothetical protein VMR45_01440 [Patescibacteria group bacterium]|nr:hypothetical protein [Patescibacteria group bacterium]